MSTDVSDLPLRAVLMLLALGSGLIDAARYLGLGHVFTPGSGGRTAGEQLNAGEQRWAG